MKSFARFADEMAAVNLKQDRRDLAREKELYAYWRDSKVTAIEHARKCKALGLLELQARWQTQAAKYDSWAKESKARIRSLGRYIYG